MKNRITILLLATLCILAFFAALQTIRRSKQESAVDPAHASTHHSAEHRPDAADDRRRMLRSKVRHTSNKLNSPAYLRMILASLHQSGMVTEELDVLSKFGESENWEISEYHPGGLVIKPKHGAETRIQLHAYPMGEKAAVVLHIQHIRSSVMKTWIYDDRDHSMTEEQLIPKISVNDLYADKDKVPGRDQIGWSVTTALGEDGVVKYYPNIWMDKDFENKKAAFEITATWDSDRFVLRKSPLKQP